VPIAFIFLDELSLTS